MRGRGRVSCLAAAVFCASPAFADTTACDVARDVTAQDTLYSLAEQIYGDAQQWPNLYFANQPLLAGRDMQLQTGDVLFIPCLDATLPPGAAATFADGPPARLWLPDALPPFSGRVSDGGGLIGRLVSEALAASSAPVALTLGDTAQPDDMVLLRSEADCAALPGGCEDWLISDPLMQVPVMRFRASAPTGDAAGSLCGPVSGLTAPSPPARALRSCLDDLVRGAVAAVEADALTAGAAISAAGLQGQVVADPDPVRHDTFRIAIPRAHWRGTTLIFRLNEGLGQLRGTGRFDRIVAQALSGYWARVGQ